MLESYIAAAGVEASEVFNRSHADVSANCMQRGITGDRASGDMTAACCRDQIAGDILHRDVSAVRIQTRGSANISREDVAACCGDSKPPVEIFGFNIATAGGEFDIVVLRNIYFDRNPQPAAALASGSLSAQIH